MLARVHLQDRADGGVHFRVHQDHRLSVPECLENDMGAELH